MLEDCEKRSERLTDWECGVSEVNPAVMVCPVRG
jgi:hypothetical protein